MHNSMETNRLLTEPFKSESFKSLRDREFLQLFFQDIILLKKEIISEHDII